MKKRICAFVLIFSMFMSIGNVNAAMIDEAYIDNGILNVSGGNENIKSSILGIYVLKEYIDPEQIATYENPTDWLSDITFTSADQNGNYSAQVPLSKSNYDNSTLYVSGNGYSQMIYLGGYNIYVSPEGDDSGTGSMSSPLKTLRAAKDKVAEFKNGDDYDGSDINVIFMPGEYKTTEIVEFTSEDSGTENAPVTYKAYKPGTVSFNYAKKLDISKFEKVSDEQILQRLPENARDNVYVMSLSGITDYDSIPTSFPRLILNNKLQTISRYPNVGYKTMLLSDGTSAIVNDGTNGEKPVFRYEDENISRWTTAVGTALVGGYLNNQYVGGFPILDSIDTVNKTITLRTNTIKDDVNRRWYARNLLEEIDIPGEFYIQRSTADDSNNYLYYYPSYELNATKDTLEYIPGTHDGYIRLNNVSYVNFEGINFSKTCGNAILGTDCTNIIVDGCEAEFTMRGGFIFENTTNTVIKNCTVHNSGAEGISITLTQSDEERLNMVNCGNLIHNNHIYSVREGSATNAAANNIAGFGAVMTNNTIHKSPTNALYSPSAEGYYGYNELYNVIRDSADVGAIYNGRTLTMYGTKYEYNYIHDMGIEGIKETENTSGIFWDDFGSGQIAENNIIVNYFEGHEDLNLGASFGINMNGGRDNTIKNNIVVGCDYAFRNTDRSNDKYEDVGMTKLYNDLKNIVEGNEDTPYVKKYPQMVDTYREMSSLLNGYRFNPKNLTITGNVVADCSMATEENNGVYLNGRLVSDNTSFDEYNVAKTVTVDNYVCDDTSIFVSPETGDYRLSDSGREQLGVDIDFKLDESFDLNSIGYQGDYTVDNDFRMLYPLNNSVTDNSAPVTLVWEEALFADEYEYIISQNPDLSEPVVRGTTIFTIKEIDSLMPGTKYYWKVTAKNTSFKNGEFADSESGVYEFTTSYASITESSYNSVNNTINIIIDNSPAEIEADIYVGEYDIEDRLVKASKYERKLQKGESNILLNDYSPFSESSYGIIFVWNKNTQKPITKKSDKFIFN